MEKLHFFFELFAIILAQVALVLFEIPLADLVFELLDFLQNMGVRAVFLFDQLFGGGKVVEGNRIVFDLGLCQAERSIHVKQGILIIEGDSLFIMDDRYVILFLVFEGVSHVVANVGVHDLRELTFFPLEAGQILFDDFDPDFVVRDGFIPQFGYALVICQRI